MQIKKGKINNINKKLLAGALAFTLLTISLTGCYSNEIKYKVNQQGQIEGIEGKLTPSYVDDCKFYKVLNKETNEEYYTIGYCQKKHIISDKMDIYDLFTNQSLCNEEIFEITYCADVNDYLLNYKLVKDQYSEESLKEILKIFVREEKEKQQEKIKK